MRRKWKVIKNILRRVALGQMKMPDNVLEGKDCNFLNIALPGTLPLVRIQLKLSWKSFSHNLGL